MCVCVCVTKNSYNKRGVCVWWFNITCNVPLFFLFYFFFNLFNHICLECRFKWGERYALYIRKKIHISHKQCRFAHHIRLITQEWLLGKLAWFINCEQSRTTIANIYTTTTIRLFVCAFSHCCVLFASPEIFPKGTKKKTTKTREEQKQYFAMWHKQKPKLGKQAKSYIFIVWKKTGTRTTHITNFWMSGPVRQK
jgi:hypothetical protein